MKKSDESIGIDALLLSVYFALAPMHQTLLLFSGGTLVKYLAFLVMCACVLNGYINSRKFVMRWELIWPVLLMLGWFALSIIWADSMSTAVSKLISIGSYCAMMLIVGARQWNRKERTLFLLILILSCMYYALQLISSSATARRATLSLALDEEAEAAEADQNVVACNVGFGALAAFHIYLKRKGGIVKWAALAGMLIIMVGIIATGSRGGTLAVCSGLAYLIYKQSEADIKLRKRILLIIIGALVAYWLIFDLNILQNDFLISRFTNVNASSISGRSTIWGQYFGLLFSRPVGFLCGYGCGCETVAHAAYMGRNWARASHNDCIAVICEFGIIGLLLIASFVRDVWRKCRRDGHFLGCACIVLALIGCMDINFYRTYGWWNAMLIAYIGIDGSLLETQKTVSIHALPRRRKNKLFGRGAQ